MRIDFKRLSETAVTPMYGSQFAAGMDLYADLKGDEYVAIQPHKTLVIGTGIAMAIPVRHFGGIFARSGLATKEGLRPANCVGVIDADYRGEICVAIHNDTDEEKTINAGDRIAQIIILPYMEPMLVETETLSDTQRGAGGFGSTGK